jgi:uncharacterized surface protein with fasciclin (FAS1) repeats
MRLPRTLPALALAALAACTTKTEQPPAADGETVAAAPAATVAATGQAGVQDAESMPDVVKVAVGSKDHTTLVTALQKADLVNSLANAGPFTVFAPTNAAFEKLPAGTVESLLKPENVDKLRGVLQHHVTVPALEPDALTDGLDLSMVDGGRAKVQRQGDAITVGGAKVLATVRASNGVVYVVDSVILPQ